LSLGHSHLLNSGRVGLLCLCASVAILAATVDFAGVVRSMDGLAVVQEQIHIDTGGTYRTSDSGEFTIPASEGLKVGAEVVFHVSHWVVLRPCELQNGRTYLPAQGRPIQMKVLRPGDPRLKSIVPVESRLGQIGRSRLFTPDWTRHTLSRRTRVLMWTDPGSKWLTFSRRKKLFLRRIQCKTPPKEKTFTVVLPRRLSSIWRRGSPVDTPLERRKRSRKDYATVTP